ncbi:MAG: T9SS type A sorting domain-containing protein, partial [Chitinophagales bacterium]|nr:T9SS type A sorting domain-containing protein [Chitinophagales bacterium]
DLEPGVYAVTVTDDLGCSQSEVIVINRLGCEPPTVEAIATDAPCYGDNGTVKVGLTGGLAPFTYAWTSGASSSEVELPAGKHAVIVTDSLGCIGYAAVEIKQPEAIEVSIQVTDEQCYGEENGSIAVEVSGAFPPFTYAWSQGSTESTLTGLSPEDYTATITDANGCSVEIAATVGEATQLEVPIVGDTLVCYGEAGTIEVALGYVSYEWSTGDSTSTISWTESGDYTVTVTNEQGCTAIATLTTTVNDVLEAIINKEDNGFVLEVKGGTSPYTYLWSTGEATEKITPASVGTYTVTVTDSNGCSVVVEADFTVATKEEEAGLQVHVFPNPTSNILYIVMPETSRETMISVYDGAGRLLVIQREAEASVIKMDISSLIPGTYVLQVQNESGYYRAKVLKQ